MSSRPLSPHLSIYKPQITSVLSITHRLSGLFIFIGMLYISWLIIFSNYSDLLFAEKFVSFNSMLFSNWFGKLAIFAWNFAFCYHFCNGIRHLIWDTGRGFSICAVKRSGLLVILASTVLSLVIWNYAISNLI